MAEIRARKKLLEVSLRWQKPISSDSFLKIFKNPENKYSYERQFNLLRQMFRPHVVEFQKHEAQFDEDVKKNNKSPYEAFINFLVNITIIPLPVKPQIPAKPQISDSKMSSKSDFESPALCSTRVDNNYKQEVRPELVVSEIKEKLAQATQQTHSQSSRASTTYLVRQSFNSSTASLNSKKMVLSPPLALSKSTSTWNFSFNEDPILPIQMKMPKPIIGLPASAQERAIIKELLNTLIGVNGTLVVPTMKTISYDKKEDYAMMNQWAETKLKIVEFDLNEQIQESIRDMLQDILPLANYFFQIHNFIEVARAPESGQVLQALSAAISKLMADYCGTIAQLETMHNQHDLTLNKMQFYLRPVIQTMETITKVCNMLQSQNVRGGNVLTRLHDNIALYSGDKNSQQILIHLTQKAAEPYMEILKLWIFKGVIQDPKMEFLVEDNEKEFENIQDNVNYFENFWNKRYVICSEKVPRFLEKQADVILRTGKYLNVVRECGKRVVFNQSHSSLKFSHTDEQNYINIITDAYTFASKALLELVMDDNDLLGHLMSVKRYFLLQQGDFIVQFMEACEGELMNYVNEVIPTRLENLLELTLRLSSAKHDKYQDDLYTTLIQIDVCAQMGKILKTDQNDVYDEIQDVSTLKGIECFSFGYNVAWPLSIVLNHMTLSKYQLIFRQLFYCKHVENYLCRVWIANKNAKKFDHRTSELYRSAFTLRQRMMNAIQNLEYYMMIEVIEPFWHIFMQQLAKAKNIDDVLVYHEDFLDHILKNCMMIYPELLKRIISVCKSCVAFCEFIEEAQRHFIDAELSSMLSKSYIDDDSSDQQETPICDEDPEAKTATFSEKVAEYDKVFTKNVVRLLDSVQEIAEKHNSEKFVSLSNRINFNHYYTEQLKSHR